ncbi:MAG: formate dehydrogenase accessory sulfurtransferase FdhD [Bacteroidia bacterium]|jgi:FdhD protein|nr:formate dehydrogenase accessory sulfurtransferase FdhD [Bacteroidia bacterium]
MTRSSVSSIQITKINGNDIQQTVDLLAVEEPLEIRLGYGPSTNRTQKSISVTMRTPGNDFELALGFLITEGIIESANQIYKIHYCTEANTIENKENIVRVELNPEVEIDLSKLQRNFYATSSCGVCGKESIEAIKVNCKLPITDFNFQISKDVIVSLPDKLRTQQNVFEHTGGLHACALFTKDGALLLLREDVGRHNAMDKLVGAHFGKPNAAINEYILLLSGRASFELLQKASMAGIPIVCAVGAPSSLAVQTAQEFGITLIGFLRGNRFNIYCHSDRIQ